MSDDLQNMSGYYFVVLKIDIEAMREEKQVASGRLVEVHAWVPLYSTTVPYSSSHMMWKVKLMANVRNDNLTKSSFGYVLQ